MAAQFSVDGCLSAWPCDKLATCPPRYPESLRAREARGGRMDGWMDELKQQISDCCANLYCAQAGKKHVENLFRGGAFERKTPNSHFHAVSNSQDWQPRP